MPKRTALLVCNYPHPAFFGGYRKKNKAEAHEMSPSRWISPIFHANIITQPRKIVKYARKYTSRSRSLHSPAITPSFSQHKGCFCASIFDHFFRVIVFLGLVNIIYVIMQTNAEKPAFFLCFSEQFPALLRLLFGFVNLIYPPFLN